MPQLGVNSYLWRATLDTLNFMPLASADPVGSVVISDWYAAPDKPDGHVKVTVYILDRRLRDAVRGRGLSAEFATPRLDRPRQRRHRDQAGEMPSWRARGTASLHHPQ
jgi:hypothetical protein